MSSSQRQELILKKMKAKRIELWSRIPKKKYDNKQIYELIHIANGFPELIEKNKNIQFDLLKLFILVPLKQQ